MNRQSVLFLGTGGTVQAAAADITVNNHFLSFTGGPFIDTRLVESYKVRAAVAETAGVITVTPTAAASKTYTLAITQFVQALGQTVTETISYTSKADGTDTATTICDALRLVIAPLISAGRLSLVASGTATFIMTTSAGSPQIRAVSGGDGVLAVVNTTPGVSAVNTKAALDVILPANAGQVAGQSYTSVEITYRDPSSDETSGNVNTGRAKLTVYINQAATNFAALNTRIGEVANGFVSGGTTADPEIMALNGL